MKEITNQFEELRADTEGLDSNPEVSRNPAGDSENNPNARWRRVDRERGIVGGERVHRLKRVCLGASRADPTNPLFSKKLFLFSSIDKNNNSQNLKKFQKYEKFYTNYAIFWGSLGVKSSVDKKFWPPLTCESHGLHRSTTPCRNVVVIAASRC